MWSARCVRHRRTARPGGKEGVDVCTARARARAGRGRDASSASAAPPGSAWGQGDRPVGPPRATRVWHRAPAAAPPRAAGRVRHPPAAHEAGHACLRYSMCGSARLRSHRYPWAVGGSVAGRARRTRHAPPGDAARGR
eukprot:3110619-Pleurochrysis_carterae.AAC.1